MSGEAEHPADRGQRPTLRVIKSPIGGPGGRRRRTRPWGKITRMLTAEAELMQGKEVVRVRDPVQGA